MRLVLALASVSAAAGCIDPFGGSFVELDFHEEVPVSARPGETPAEHQPPANTHLVLYATDYVYADADGDGRPDVDATSGEKILESSWVFEVKQFELRPVIDLTSPCFIDIEGARFPGLHATRYEAKLREVTGITDPFAPGQNAGDVQDVLTAARRIQLQPLVASGIKVVSSYGGNVPYPAFDPAGSCDQELPPPSCIDDTSNARRLAVCQRAWDEHPDYYEGSDRVFSLPLNGTFFGVAQGSNPINGGNIGGAGIYVDSDLSHAEGFFLNWKYNDDAMNTDPYGEHFMIGTPINVTRGVINSRLQNFFDSRVQAELAVFPDLGQDDVNF